MNNAPFLFPHNTPTTKEVKGKLFFENIKYYLLRHFIFAKASTNIFQVKQLRKLY